eukprot:3201745-Alexandrium_andersonii.AAC.1
MSSASRRRLIQAPPGADPLIRAPPGAALIQAPPGAATYYCIFTGASRRGPKPLHVACYRPVWAHFGGPVSWFEAWESPRTGF